MFCPKCGTKNAELTKFCMKCAQPLEQGSQPVQPVVNALNPFGTQAYAGPTQTSGKAIGAFICGLLFFFLPTSIAAVVLGHISLSDIRKSAGRLAGRGIAITGLVLGYIGLAFIPFILIVAAIAIPNLLRARGFANEASAMGSLRVISIAAASYASTYPNGYPPSLGALGSVGPVTCNHAALIDPVLAAGIKSGYVFVYTPTYDSGVAPALSPQASQAGCSQPGATGFMVTADPVRRGNTGQRSFYVDQTGVVRYEPYTTASANSTPIQ